MLCRPTWNTQTHRQERIRARVSCPRVRVACHPKSKLGYPKRKPGLANSHPSSYLSWDARHRPCAFTLIELIVVLTIIGVLSAVAVPRFANSLTRQRLDAAQRRIELDLTQTQQLARFTGTPQRIIFDLIGNAYGINALADPDRAGQTHTVRLGQEPYGVTLVAVDFEGNPFLDYDVFGTPQQDGYIKVGLGGQSREVVIGTPILPWKILPPVN